MKELNLTPDLCTSSRLLWPWGKKNQKTSSLNPCHLHLHPAGALDITTVTSIEGSGVSPTDRQGFLAMPCHATTHAHNTLWVLLEVDRHTAYPVQTLRIRLFSLENIYANLFAYPFLPLILSTLI